MNLTLTNNGPWAVPVISTDDDGYAESLEPNYPLQVDNDDVLVLIVGNKPSVTEQIQQAADTIADFVKDIVTAWQENNNKATSSDEASVKVAIKNDGENAVRCILGDGVTDTTIEPGATYDATAWGYVELRELGHVPGTDDPAQQQGQTIA